MGLLRLPECSVIIIHHIADLFLNVFDYFKLSSGLEIVAALVQ